MGSDQGREQERTADLNDAYGSPEPQTESQLERVWNRVRNYGFSIGNRNILLTQGLYSELLIQPKIAPLPNSPSHFLGLTNVRGNLVPVYRLDLWMGDSVAVSTASPRYALMIDEIDSGVAVVVDDKPQSINLGDCQPQPRSGEGVPPQLNAVTEATYRGEGQTWHLLNHQHLFRELCFAQIAGTLSQEESF